MLIFGVCFVLYLIKLATLDRLCLYSCSGFESSNGIFICRPCFRYVDENREGQVEKIETQLKLLEEKIDKFNQERGKLTSEMDALKDDLAQRKVLYNYMTLLYIFLISLSVLNCSSWRSSNDHLFYWKMYLN